MEFSQGSFGGGMNLYDEGVNLGTEEYSYAFNVRNRMRSLDGVKGPVKDGIVASGLKQGLFAFDNILICVIAGNIYYKNAGDFSWSLINGVSLSPTAPRVWACAVPVATTLNERQTATANIYEPIVGGKLMSDGSPAGIILQDNVSQPVIIYSDMTSETLQTYAQWTLTSREYVPVGNIMTYSGGILYIVSVDQKSIYRSVSGRPCDFVINIQSNADGTAVDANGVTIVDGDKGGNADTTSYAVGYSPITCMKALSDGRIFVSTITASYFITPTTATTIFGEPTFIKQDAFPFGLINNDSCIDILQDTAMLMPSGIRSFNAVRQLRYDGNQSPFSLKISPLFGDEQNPIQQYPYFAGCCLSKDWAYFYVQTILGHCIVVYDVIRQQWVSIDTQMGGVAIKQMAATFDNVTGVQRIFCITANDELYELYADSTNLMPCTLYTREFSGAAPSVNLRCKCVHAVFRGGTDQSSVRLLEFADGVPGEIQTQYLPIPSTVNTVNFSAYVVPLRGNKLRFDMDSVGNIGFKLQYMFWWPANTKFVQFCVITDDISDGAGIAQLGQAYGSNPSL